MLPFGRYMLAPVVHVCSPYPKSRNVLHWYSTVEACVSLCVNTSQGTIETKAFNHYSTLNWPMARKFWKLLQDTLSLSLSQAVLAALGVLIQVVE